MAQSKICKHTNWWAVDFVPAEPPSPQTAAPRQTAEDCQVPCEEWRKKKASLQQLAELSERPRVLA